MGRPHVVIVGGGFGGLACARALRSAPVEVTLLDCHNYHTFTPFLYQVATALLETSAAVEPLRQLLRRVPNTTFRLGQVTGVDFASRTVHTDQDQLGYDYLVLAAGAVNDYFGHAELANRTFGLGDLPEALHLRDRLLLACEQAAWSSDPEERERLLHFAVVGGGPTGVELAGALAELMRHALTRDYPDLHMDVARITLVEGSDAPLSVYSERLQRAACSALERKGVEVISKAQATAVDEAGLHLADGRVIDAATVVWAAGVRAAPLAQRLDAERGSHDRVKVTQTLQIADRPEVFVIGDLAEIPDGNGGSLPMLAQVAIQSGRHAASNIEALTWHRSPTAFRYRDLGTMATQGRNAAVAEIGPLKLSGFVGWLAWLLVHIARMVGLRTRLIVLLDWTAGYLLVDRPVRLITGAGRPPQPEPEPRQASHG